MRYLGLCLFIVLLSSCASTDKPEIPIAWAKPVSPPSQGCIDLGMPLIYAAEHGHIAIVRLLLARNAYLLSRNSEGLTAFELAQRNGHASIAQLLQTYRMEPK